MSARRPSTKGCPSRSPSGAKRWSSTRRASLPSRQEMNRAMSQARMLYRPQRPSTSALSSKMPLPAPTMPINRLMGVSISAGSQRADCRTFSGGRAFPVSFIFLVLVCGGNKKSAVSRGDGAHNS